MELINGFASIVWLFFSWLGEISQIPLWQVVRGYRGTVTNPFNSNTWNVFIPDSLIPDPVFDFIFSALGVPTDMTVLGAFLLIVAIVFVVSILVGLITQILP